MNSLSFLKENATDVVRQTLEILVLTTQQTKRMPLSYLVPMDCWQDPNIIVNISQYVMLFLIVCICM